MELIENKDLFQTVFNSSSNSIAVIQSVYNDKGKVYDFAVLLLNTYTLNRIGNIDYKGKSYSDVFPFVKETDIIEKFIEVAETGITANFERSYSGKNAKHWFWFTVVKQADLIVVTAEDITERKQAESALNNALAASEKQKRLYDSIVNNTPDLVYVFDLSYNFTYANKALLTMWGKSAEDAIGLGLRENGYEEWHALMHEREIDEVVATKKAIRGTVSFPHAELGIRIYDYILVPVFNERGEVEVVAGTTRDITEIKLAEERIQESENRFRNMIEQAPVAILLSRGEDVVIESINKPMLQFMNKNSPEEVLGKKMIETLPELVGQQALETVIEVQKTGIPFRGDDRPVDLLINGKLERCYFNFSYDSIKEPGKIPAVLHMAVDVTSQVKAHRLLEENQEFIRKIFYSSPVANLVYVGKEMILREANEKILEIFGRDSSIIGKPILETIPELKNTDLFEKYKTVLATGEIYQVNAQRIDLIKNGELHIGYYDYTYKPLCDDNDVPYGVICITFEVTDQVYARQKQQEAEAGLKDAIELAQLGTWSIDVATNGLIYSDRLIEWFGFDPNDKDYNEVIPVLLEEDQERVAKAVAWALNPESGGIYDEVYTVIHPVTGYKRILHAQGKTVFDLAGKAIRMDGTAKDVTIQYEAQMALEQQVLTRTEELAAAVDELGKTNNNLEKSNIRLLQSNEELQQFAYIASHDLQEPLRKIITFSNMLETSLGESKTPKAQNYMDKIMHASMRMRSLINDVLSYSQLAKSDEQFTKVDLNEIVENLIIDYDLLIEQKNAKISIQNLPVIKANPMQMTQLFRNLIGNALKFSEKDRDPIISISVEPVEIADLEKIHVSNSNSEFCKIKLKDNGIGFEAEYFERIFNIFQRLHSKTDYEGTGIGLAMCKKIVQNHGGDIFAESTPGDGALFTIIIPVNLV